MLPTTTRQEFSIAAEAERLRQQFDNEGYGHQLALLAAERKRPKTVADLRDQIDFLKEQVEWSRGLVYQEACRLQNMTPQNRAWTRGFFVSCRREHGRYCVELHKARAALAGALDARRAA